MSVLIVSAFLSIVIALLFACFILFRAWRSEKRKNASLERRLAAKKAQDAKPDPAIFENMIVL